MREGHSRGSSPGVDVTMDGGGDGVHIDAANSSASLDSEDEKTNTSGRQATTHHNHRAWSLLGMFIGVVAAVLSYGMAETRNPQSVLPVAVGTRLILLLSSLDAQRVMHSCMMHVSFARARMHAHDTHTHTYTRTQQRAFSQSCARRCAHANVLLSAAWPPCVGGQFAASEGIFRSAFPLLSDWQCERLSY